MKRMTAKILFFTCILFACRYLNAQTNVWQPSPGHVQIPIWPGTPPDADVQPLKGPEYVTNQVTQTGRPFVWVRNVSKPTMTVYSPTGTNTGVAMVVFPGGGYNELAMNLEGTEICDWLTSKGITAVLLKYRVPNKKIGDYWEAPLALQDAQRTLGLVRFHAAGWHINPHKIGVIGFSAGGHMVAATSTHFEKRSYPAVDEADHESCRPDFAVACYPGHLWSRDEGFHLNPNVPVTTNTPPTFLLQAEDDHVDGVEQSLVYYVGLKNAGVPVEMHLYAQGGHGFGLRHPEFPVSEWPQLVEKWLVTIGVTSSSLTKRSSVEAILEQMRGLNMQPPASPTTDGRINSKEQQREEIMQQLRTVGQEAIPALIHALGDSDVQMRRNAELVMIILAGGYDGQMKMNIRDAVPALIGATQDKDSDVRAWAAHALAEAGPDAVEAVPALMKLLDDPYTGSRNCACMALGDIGPAASAALPALERALHDSSGEVRRFAGQAIKKIQGQ